MNLSEQRLARLELSNKRLKRALALALLLVSSVVLMAQGGGDRGTLQGESLALVHDGHKYAEIGKWNGNAGLRLFDTEGKVRCELSLTNGKQQVPGLRLRSEGNGGVVLEVVEKACSLVMASADESTKATLVVFENSTWCDFTARCGDRPLYHAGVYAGEGGAKLTASGGGGDQAALIGVPGGDGGGWNGLDGPTVLLQDTLGRKRAMLGLDRHGAPGLAVFDDSETTRVAIGSVAIGHRNGPGRLKYTPLASPIVTFDKDGKPTWKAP